MGPVFLEFFGPFNLLREPPYLTAIELTFWGVAALAEARWPVDDRLLAWFAGRRSPIIPHVPVRGKA